jgi:hypothetical protein
MIPIGEETVRQQILAYEVYQECQDKLLQNFFRVCTFNRYSGSLLVSTTRALRHL